MRRYRASYTGAMPAEQKEADLTEFAYGRRMSARLSFTLQLNIFDSEYIQNRRDRVLRNNVVFSFGRVTGPQCYIEAQAVTGVDAGVNDASSAVFVKVIFTQDPD
ncbi:predicted protein [Histoplasma capsulatum var. duboisii H88]|uniref:Predicted protein n=1 Tax=Ajellomyces capsulatus (strain H88) TaxID=544711 RepID=F0USG6_AJEC8|nr:predicted protein [Histoplasma capsulatum var. duboisii H88]